MNKVTFEIAIYGEFLTMERIEAFWDMFDGIVSSSAHVDDYHIKVIIE